MMKHRRLLLTIVACALSLPVLQLPTEVGAACESSECFIKQAAEYEVFARKRKNEQAQKKKEFEEWYQFESVRIDAIDVTAKIYKSIGDIHDDCKKAAGRDKIAEILNQLSKIQMRDQDKDKAHLAKKYLQNANDILKEAQALCKE
ncbi:MAG: hypothetical protein HQL66_06920 [Magnetococcales bacterium]|nr:hypothetical protein [Magnetococcales bacterium]